MVVAQKLRAVELKEAEHPIPQRARLARHAVDLERDESNRAVFRRDFQILFAQIALVGAHLLDMPRRRATYAVCSPRSPSATLNCRRPPPETAAWPAISSASTSARPT